MSTTKTAAAAKKSASASANGTAAKAPKVRSVGETSMSVADRRLAVVKAMRKMSATSKGQAVSADAIAAKCGLTRFDVYGQLYHTHHLQTSGLVAQEAGVEGIRGLAYYLTAKGAKASDEVIVGAKAAKKE